MIRNGGMMGGGMTHAPARSAGVGSYGYSPSGSTAVPTPLALGATPVPVGEDNQITAANAHFAPAQITVNPGETVHFVVTNRNPFLHNCVSQAAGIPFVNLPDNTTQTVTWTTTAQTGAYMAVCMLHAGMSLSILVRK